MSALVRLFARLLGLLPDAALAGLARTLFSRTWRELQAAAADPERAQATRLLEVVGRARSTEFGQRHGFGFIQSVDDYRRRVPLSTWDDMADDVERMVAGEQGVRVGEPVDYYATTSGTTGRRKLIPVPAGYRAECRVTNRLLYRTTLTEIPGFIRGRRLNMRSPSTEEVGPGAHAGSITVALSGGGENESALDAVPLAVYRVKDFATRYYLCLRFAAQERITICSAVNPSTLLLFAKTLEEHHEALAQALEAGTLAPEGFPLVLDPEAERALARQVRRDRAAAARIRASAAAHGGARMRDLFPHLEALVCWKGGSAPWYLSRLPRSYGELPVLDYGYAASEGMFGAPLSAEGAASVLLPHGHFLEFMPEDDVDAVRAGERPTLLLHELCVGQRYYVVVTTSAGLYRYDMNDVVEVVGHHRRAPLVVFRQKGGAMSSVTGEKLGEAHVVQAMARTACPVEPAGFCVAPLLPQGEALPQGEGEPHYLLALDVAEADLDDAALLEVARSFDAALAEVNEEYEAKRRSLRLGPARAARLPPGAIAAHRARRVAAGAPDAHVKVPHLSPDGRLLEDLGLGERAPDLAARLPCRLTQGVA